MGLTININKSVFLAALILFGIIAIFVGVAYAYVNPATGVGHVQADIEGLVGGTTSGSTLSSDEVCLGGVCKTSWGQGTPNGVWCGVCGDAGLGTPVQTSNCGSAAICSTTASSQCPEGYSSFLSSKYLSGSAGSGDAYKDRICLKNSTNTIPTDWSGTKKGTWCGLHGNGGTSKKFGCGSQEWVGVGDEGCPDGWTFTQQGSYLLGGSTSGVDSICVRDTDTDEDPPIGTWCGICVDGNLDKSVSCMGYDVCNVCPPGWQRTDMSNYIGDNNDINDLICVKMYELPA